MSSRARRSMTTSRSCACWRTRACSPCPGRDSACRATSASRSRWSVKRSSARCPASSARFIEHERADGSGPRPPRVMSGFGIGAPVKRREDYRLLTGAGRFADDVSAPGQAYAAFVRSPHAHADVGAIDPRASLALPGVQAVFTGRELLTDGVGPIPTLIADRGGGIRNRDGSPFAEPAWYPLAPDRGRHVGEPLAIVVADTPAAAEDAALAVAVHYSSRRSVVDATAALASGAPELHDGVAGNRC